MPRGFTTEAVAQDAFDTRALADRDEPARRRHHRRGRAFIERATFLAADAEGRPTCS
jgi:hypothetical protein